MTNDLDSIFRQYYGENYDKAMRLAKDSREEMRRDFLKKYPDVQIPYPQVQIPFPKSHQKIPSDKTHQYPKRWKRQRWKLTI